MFSLFFGSSAADGPQETRRAPSGAVNAAIAEGARRTGVDFAYMLKTAERESALNPTARNSSSSARGLYQFIDQTWFSMIKQEGERQGLGAYADAIIREPGGRYSVPDAQMRREILALKDDPQIASVMAGAFTSRNAADLRAAIGRNPSSGELYMAHVLGASGAAKLIATAASNPAVSAARLFPDAAAANRALFYHGNGTPKNASELYAGLSRHHGDGAARIAPSNIVAAVAQTEVKGEVSERFAPFARMSSRSPQGLFTGGQVQAYAQAQMPVAAARRSGPLDLGLFRTA